MIDGSKHNLARNTAIGAPLRALFNRWVGDTSRRGIRLPGMVDVVEVWSRQGGVSVAANDPSYASPA